MIIWDSVNLVKKNGDMTMKVDLPTYYRVAMTNFIIGVLTGLAIGLEVWLLLK